MTEEQIQMLRMLIKDEINAANIDGMEHSAWGWAEKQLDEDWDRLQNSFVDLNKQKNTISKLNDWTETTVENFADNFKVDKYMVFKWFNDWVNKNVTHDISKPVKNKDYEQLVYVTQRAAEFGYKECLKQYLKETQNA
jgi:hypothetical protein